MPWDMDHTNYPFYSAMFDAGWEFGYFRTWPARSYDLDWWHTYCMGGVM